MAGIGSISRTMSIFDLYLTGEYELSPTDVNQLAGISISTAGRTMTALCDANLLVKSSTRGKYRLSSKILDLSRVYMSSLNLLDVALPHLTWLRDKSNETAGLYIREGSERVILGAVNCEKNIQRVLTPGDRSRIYAGAPSKVLLASLPDDRIHEMLNSVQLIKVTENTKASIPEIMKEMEVVRENGYAISKAEEIEHAYAISAPIRDQNGNVVAAISVTGVTILLKDDEEQKLIKLTREAAQRISHDLGYLPS